MTLLNFSMPDLTPAETIHAQPSRKSVWKSSGRPGDAMNLPKADDTVPIASAWKPAVTDCHR